MFSHDHVHSAHVLPIHHVASSRRHSFVTGRTSLEVLVFTSAVRTCASSPGNTLVTRPSNQRHLGKFRLFSSHLWRCCNIGTYSRTHRDQKQLAMNCACLHCLREYTSSLANIPGGTKRFRCCKRRWFGVSGSISLGSSLEQQIGRLFKIDVTSANTVRNASKSTSALRLPRTAFIAFFTLLTSLSQTPDIWLAAGGWKRHSGSGHLYHSTSRECNSLLMRSSLKS